MVILLYSMSAEKLAINFFKNWVEKQGLELRDTQRSGVGYDFEVTGVDGSIKKYEVKGTTKEMKIPNMSLNEFDDKIMKADFLFVVGNIHEEGREVCYAIPREAIKPENLELKQTYRIARFQNQQKMGQCW